MTEKWPARAGRTAGGVAASALVGAFTAGRLARPEAASAPAAAAVSGPDDTLLKANDRIRDAAKWLIGSAAAVGAALIAGSQLSSIGKLEATWPKTIDDARLWVAAVGVVLALSGIAYVIWRAVGLFLPVTVTLSELDAAWQGDAKSLAPVVEFFQNNEGYLQGLKDPADLIARQAAAGAKLDSSDPKTAQEALATLQDLDAREAAILDMAQHRLLLARFAGVLRRLVGATAVVALGIVCFAWAANPPASSPTIDLRSAKLTDASLRGVDLSGATLDGADFTGADLTGADLAGASITNVVWSNTICPDKTNSDAHGHTCSGHLRS